MIRAPVGFRFYYMFDDLWWSGREGPNGAVTRCRYVAWYYRFKNYNFYYVLFDLMTVRIRIIKYMGR